MDSSAIALNQLLTYAADDLDVPAEVDDKLRARYEQLASWIKEDHSTRFRATSEIYPQGSRRLGLMIQPVNPDDDHDVDLVYRRDIVRASVTQSELKRALGEQLREFIRHVIATGDDAPELREGTRCWTLRYRDRFHMDILPALPNDDLLGRDPRSILITDRDMREWQPSNPQGYALWFEGRMIRSRLSLREAMAKSDSVTVQEIPAETVKTPLQRLVQLLKRHRDIKFQGDREDKPASIIITTIAARTYRDGADLTEAFHSFRTGARSYIQVINGEARVENPVDSQENFADRWRKHPERGEHFLEWLSQVERDAESMSRMGGIHRIAEVMSKSFGEALTDRVVRRAGAEVFALRQRGALRVAGPAATLSTVTGTVVPKHTFYGDHG